MEFINYALLIILGVVIISNPIIYTLRKNKVGDIVANVRISKDRFILLIVGIFMLISYLYTIYLDLYIRKLTISPTTCISQIM